MDTPNTAPSSEQSSSSPPSGSPSASSAPAFWVRAAVGAAGPAAILGGWIWGPPSTALRLGTWEIPFGVLCLAGIVLCVLPTESLLGIFGGLRGLLPWSRNGNGKQ